MEKILVPCDFSITAVNAFRFALDVAAKSNGKIFLLNVIELPVLQDAVVMPVLTFEQDFMKNLRDSAIAEFEKLSKQYNHHGVDIEYHVEYGLPGKMITTFTEDHAVDLIIMGSNGATGLREFFIGSNAERVVRHSPVPVLVLKDYTQDSIRDIVFPNTLETTNQEDLVMKVKLLQDFFTAKVHILYVNTTGSKNHDALEKLTLFAQRFMFKNYTTNVFNHPVEEAGIIQFAKNINADLIAMGTHGRTGVSHLLNGSVAEDVVNHTDFPIWTYVLK